ncbi:MAG: TrbI/VirB10 family protein [Hyphomonas sp.]
MTEPRTFDAHTKDLRIRQKPRSVSRINRRVLIAGAGLGAVGLFAATSIALAPPKFNEPGAATEPYTDGSTRKPVGFSALPASYDAPQIPKLGPPMPGDLGSTILETERSFGIDADYRDFETDFRPNPVSEAERARRLKEAALAEEAASAPLFFRLEARAQLSSGASADPASQNPAASFTSELLALSRTPQALTAAGNEQNDPNLQDRKSAFASTTRSDIRNPNRIEDPVSPFQLMAGSLIPASLITGINSDLPGTVIAQVTQNVYDTVRGQHLLIPQGSRLIGRYQSQVSFGQDRALVVWDRILFPDGASILISEAGSDASGYAGLKDRTDHHWDKVFAAAGLATLLGIGAELGPGEDSDIERAIRRGTTDTVNQAGQRAVDRSLGVQPSITIRPGWPVNVIVTRDLVLRPYEEPAP